MELKHNYNKILRRNWTKPMSRRALLRDGALGFGALGLAGLLADQGYAAPKANPLEPRAPHFAPKAKQVIFLFMHGGPSRLIRSTPSRTSTRTTASRCPSSVLWRSTTTKPAP